MVGTPCQILFDIDVRKLLRNKEFEQFDEIVRTYPQIVNSLRVGYSNEKLLMNLRYDLYDDVIFDHLIDLHHFNVVDKCGLNIIHRITLLNDDDNGVRRLIKLSNKMFLETHNFINTSTR